MTQGNSRDVCFLFKAQTPEIAQEWIDVIKQAKESLEEQPDVVCRRSWTDKFFRLAFPAS